MRKKKLVNKNFVVTFIVLGLAIFLLSLLAAAAYVDMLEDNHGEAVDIGPNVVTNSRGATFTYTDAGTRKVVNVTKCALCTATKAWLNHSNGTFIASAMFDGVNASIEVGLTNAAKYILTADSNGAAYNFYYTTTARGDPYFVGSNLTWNQGWNGALEVGQVQNFEAIWTAALSDVPPLGNISVSLTAPEDNSAVSVPFILLNSTITPETSDLTNATTITWFSNGTTLNETITPLAGAIPVDVSINLTELMIGNYVFNVLGCQGTGGNSPSQLNCTYADSNRTFSVGASIDAESYDAYNYETQDSNFTSNISILEGAVLYDQKLFYNGTAHQGSMIDLGSDKYTLFTDIDSPLLTTNPYSENRTFLWSITFEKDDGTFLFQNLTSSVQNTTYINMSNCAVPGATEHALNFTAWNEEDISVQLLPYDFFGTFEYWLGNGDVVKNVSNSSPGINEKNLCITPQGETFHSTAQIQYEKDEFVKRSYYLINADLTNTTQDIHLALLNSSASTSFIIDIIDENQLPVPGVYLQILRYYPGLGVSSVVEMAKTDSAGSTIGHFEAETEDYKLIISDNSSVLFESGFQKIFCRDIPCTLTFQIGSTRTTEWNHFGNITNLIWSLDFNVSTDIWTYTYVDTSGAAQEGRLHVYKEESLSKSSFCDSSVASSASTITCNVSGQSGTIYAAAYINMNGGDESLVYLKSVIIASLKDTFGNEGLFLTILILMVLAFAGLWNPSVGIVLVVFGMIVMNFIGLASFGAVFLWSMIFIALILLWEMKT